MTTVTRARSVLVESPSVTKHTSSRTLACRVVLASALLFACATAPDEERPDFGKAAIAFGGSAARVVKSGASATAEASGTAWRGVRGGFAEAGEDATYGPYPKRSVSLVRRHFSRVLGYPEDTSYQISKPTRAFMNKGLFQGGGVAWTGWLVHVRVETTTDLTKHRAEREYFVRLRDDDVVDVHTDDSLLRRVEPPAKR